MTSPDMFGLYIVIGLTPVLSHLCHKLRKIVSHLSTGLKFTISFIIIAKNYFELNFPANFMLHNFI